MTATGGTTTRNGSTHAETLQFIGGLLLIMALGLNLRPLLASASPLMEDIRAATGLGYGVLAWLTTLPFLCMGAVALASGRLSRLLGKAAASCSRLPSSRRPVHCASSAARGLRCSLLRYWAVPVLP